MKKRTLLSTVALLTCAVPFTPAQAADFDPQLNGVILFEVQNDWAVDSEDRTAEVNTMTTKIEPYFILSFNDRLSLEASFVIEQVQDPDPDDDTFFENEGIFAEEIKFVYSGDNWSAFAGKYNPTFGTAWDLAPGI